MVTNNYNIDLCFAHTNFSKQIILIQKIINVINNNEYEDKMKMSQFLKCFPLKFIIFILLKNNFCKPCVNASTIMVMNV